MDRLTLTGLGLADAPGSFVTRPLSRVELAWGGLEGDRHFGLTMRAGVRQPHHPAGTELRNARQLSIVSEEELAEIAAELGVPSVGWAWLGANLCVRGLPGLTALAPSTRVLFPSGACLVIDGENRPCRGPGREVQRHHPGHRELEVRFVKAAHRRRGVVAWVERPGAIAVGDEASLLTL